MPGVEESSAEKPIIYKSLCSPICHAVYEQSGCCHAQFRLTQEMQHHPGVSLS